jgi:hypothetical protein
VAKDVRGRKNYPNSASQQILFEFINLRKLNMSFIQIFDLDRCGRDSLITLSDTESASITGGTEVVTKVVSPIVAPISPTSIISPLTSASSISLSSFSQNNILNFAANTKFNTSFTVSATSVRPSISGSIEIQFLPASAKVTSH